MPWNNRKAYKNGKQYGKQLYPFSFHNLLTPLTAVICPIYMQKVFFLRRLVRNSRSLTISKPTMTIGALPESFSSFAVDSAGRQNAKQRHRENQPDVKGRVHEKRLRHDIDQQIGGRVQNPQVIVKKDLMKYGEIFRKIRGDQHAERQGYGRQDGTYGLK